MAEAGPAKPSPPATPLQLAGLVKQGKSKLINALVNAPACPVADDIATSVPTVVQYGDTASAAILVPRAGSDATDEANIERRPVPIADLPSYVSERGNP